MVVFWGLATVFSLVALYFVLREIKKLEDC